MGSYQAGTRMGVNGGSTVVGGAPAVEPPITRENVVGRFLLAPPSLWPGVSAGGWCVKVMKSTTKPDVTTVKFNDSTVTFSFAVVASWKPAS